MTGHVRHSLLPQVKELHEQIRKCQDPKEKLALLQKRNKLIADLAVLKLLNDPAGDNG